MNQNTPKSRALPILAGIAVTIAALLGLAFATTDSTTSGTPAPAAEQLQLHDDAVKPAEPTQAPAPAPAPAPAADPSFELSDVMDCNADALELADSDPVGSMRKSAECMRMTEALEEAAGL